MDTLTHALSGVLAARAFAPPLDRSQLTAVAAAAAFPDLDYALMLIDPSAFLNLHRGPTHSLLLLPLWPGLLALPAGRILDIPWRRCTALCGFAILIHILGDWVTLYGTQLLYPLSQHPFALAISFDMNPWIAVVTLAGFLIGLFGRAQGSARLTLMLIALILFGQAYLKTVAVAVGTEEARNRGIDVHRVQALPRPTSPSHWTLLHAQTDGHAIAHLNLLGKPSSVMESGPWFIRMNNAYRSRNDLDWTIYRHPWAEAPAREAWLHPSMMNFRRFAKTPALLNMVSTARETCVWFTDLRHLLPGLPAPFRYGLCRTNTGKDWRPYRLRYFSDEQRQAL